MRNWLSRNKSTIARATADAWVKHAASLGEDRLRYFAGKRLRHYAPEELGKFQMTGRAKRDAVVFNRFSENLTEPIKFVSPRAIKTFVCKKSCSDSARVFESCAKARRAGSGSCRSVASS